MPEKHRRYFLKDKEAKALLAKSSEKLKIKLDQLFKGKTSFEVVETDFGLIYLVNGKPLLAKIEESVFPTLLFDEFLATAPKIIVDMGAVPYVCKGANVMAPGIGRFEGEFVKDDFVVVVDERHGKALAIGKALYNSEDAKKTKHGSVVTNIHFVSDRVWSFIKYSASRV